MAAIFLQSRFFRTGFVLIHSAIVLLAASIYQLPG